MCVTALRSDSVQPPKSECQDHAQQERPSEAIEGIPGYF